MKKIALVSGITGQDGSYLAEFLIKKGYVVHGIKRKSSSFNTGRLDHLYIDPHNKTNFFLHYGDLTDSSNLIRIIGEIQPDEIYNLGGGRPQSVARLVELLDSDNVVSVPKRPGEPDCTWADVSKLRMHLGWEPTVSFEKGVAVMLQHIEYWRDAPLWDVASIQTATESWFNSLSKEKL